MAQAYVCTVHLKDKQERLHLRQSSNSEAKMNGIVPSLGLILHEGLISMS